uniref:H(+)-transporting two-sector ATPase n=1 Tax=Entransia fimbriata TaxID=130991 RepID=U5YE67_9VIRI|nr:ATP synthase F0 subunit 8 [Entransia fimbriata]AGZ90283.1 ATP synthase F0 subunit 8 [Entransia fimbriata]
MFWNPQLGVTKEPARGRPSCEKGARKGPSRYIMPQLDSTTFFTQFFWLCVLFFTYYILIINKPLPYISRILKVRAKLIEKPRRDASAVDAGDPHGDPKGERSPGFQTHPATGNLLKASAQQSVAGPHPVVLDTLSQCQSFLLRARTNKATWLQNQQVIQWNKIASTETIHLGQFNIWQTLIKNLLRQAQISFIGAGSYVPPSYNSNDFLVAFFLSLFRKTQRKVAKRSTSDFNKVTAKNFDGTVTASKAKKIRTKK